MENKFFHYFYTLYIFLLKNSMSRYTTKKNLVSHYETFLLTPLKRYVKMLIFSSLSLKISKNSALTSLGHLVVYFCYKNQLFYRNVDLNGGEWEGCMKDEE